MIGGTYGKILHVDLATGEIHIEEPCDDFYRLLVGGRAVIAYLLLRDLAPNTDPLGKDNLLIFAPGILQGTNLPGSGRHAVGGKSPLTGAIGSSEAGGWWGHEFKRSGYDALVIHGRSERPVYISIHDEQATILPAEHLWGLPTADAQSIIRSELRDDRVRVAQIGSAGECQVRYSSIIHDVNRSAARNGMGALMGSKNLKAVAVRGTQNPPIKVRARMQNTARWLIQVYRDLCAWAAAGRGTQDLLMYLGYMGGLPTHNFNLPIFNEYNLLSGERNYEMYFKKRDTCQACPINCKQVFVNHAEDERHTLDPRYGGAEYEGMAAMGTCCGVSDNLAVLKANELCNKFGLDVISTGMSIAFVMDCFEQGFLNSTDTGGLTFRWGDGDMLIKSIEMIALREGFGDIMAEGVARMSARFGPRTEPLNLTVKKQELPMHEPRLKHLLGLGYAVAPVGADHEMNVHDTEYVEDGPALQRVNTALESKVGPVSNTMINEDKMQIFFHELNWKHFQDCAVLCHFYPYSYHHMAEALSGITGIEYGIQDILEVGERAQVLSRLFNLREGFTTEDDRLPKRVMIAFKEGPLADVAIKPKTFEWAKKRFYGMMLWNSDTGTPSSECLKKLQLTELLEGII
jgi:aldehyde:ferredoxin oxidoreductase